MKFTFDYDLFSDLHKDAFGFRPRNHRFYSELTTDMERQEDWDYVCKCFESEQERLQNAEIQSDLNFEKMIEGNLFLGAEDRTAAIRWILEAEDMSDYDLAYGFSYVSWSLGISKKYRDEVSKVIDKIIEEIKDGEKTV